MTHELIEIVEAYQHALRQDLKSVLVTVVDLNGSSYRKPGVRMLISENGQMTCAVSGGCVEKEIDRQAQSVFKTGVPKIMTYDGRYRLGCEGLIYILIEPFKPSTSFLKAFKNIQQSRKVFSIESYYHTTVGSYNDIGSVFHFSGIDYTLQPELQFERSKNTFKQTLQPNFRLLIFGSEHDAVQLCNFATMCGWEVEILTPSTQIQHLDQFSKAKYVRHIQSNEIQNITFDSETAVVLMTHNFAKDLSYLLELANHDTRPNYIGILGAKKRMRQLESALFEQIPHIDDSFIELLHGPAGLNIGSVTPQEIAISIISEITQHVRKHSKVLQD